MCIHFYHPLNYNIVTQEKHYLLLFHKKYCKIKATESEEIMKLIGVTPRILVEDGVQKQFVNTRYVKPLHERQLNTIMLTMDNPNLEAILALCDGFLITGGSDIDPKYYDENNDGESKNCIPGLDEVDQKVVAYARQHKLPVLGICRGHQAINVFLGGSLFQHVGDDHRNVKHNHEVKTIKNDLLAFEDQILVNSYHHQTVKQLAPGLQAIAHHPDGTIEAFIHEHLPMIGIQWHPEVLIDEKESQMIFDKFAELVQKKL